MKLTHSQIKTLAGDPLILAASDEQAIREEWKRRDRVFRAAMRWYRKFYCPELVHWTPGSDQEQALAKACAAARKK